MIEARFLLDTNICIYLLDGQSPHLLAQIEDRPRGSVVSSAVAFAEVMIGAVRRRAVPEALRFFEAVPPLPFDLAAGHAYANLPFRRGSFDRLIAAHAISLGLTLVTNNDADFVDIPGLCFENWTR